MSSSLKANSTACRHLPIAVILVSPSPNEESANKLMVPWLVSWNRSSSYARSSRRALGDRRRGVQHRSKLLLKFRPQLRHRFVLAVEMHLGKPLHNDLNAVVKSRSSRVVGGIKRNQRTCH